MSDKTSKLARLGEILPVDDTEELPRPDPEPSVADILTRGRGRDPESTPSEEDEPANHPAETVRPPPPEPSEASTPPAPPARSDPTTDPAAQPAAREKRTRRSKPTGPAESLHRSSANMPVTLVERLILAKRDRRELTALIESGLDHLKLTTDDADSVWRLLQDDVRVTRNYRATQSVLERLDQLGVEWRMNRSEVISVITTAELDRLGVAPTADQRL